MHFTVVVITPCCSWLFVTNRVNSHFLHICIIFIQFVQARTICEHARGTWDKCAANKNHIYTINGIEHNVLPIKIEPDRDQCFRTVILLLLVYGLGKKRWLVRVSTSAIHLLSVPELGIMTQNDFINAEIVTGRTKNETCRPKIDKLNGNEKHLKHCTRINKEIQSVWSESFRKAQNPTQTQLFDSVGVCVCVCEWARVGQS